MYFLTNKEDYIVAASSDFLTAIGSREICSISAMLQNQLITLDELNNKLNISNKDLEYDYKLSTMHSAFGNLNLYTLTTPVSNTQVDEDENIAYLKKIQEGTIDKKDNEYAIPNIPTLQKEAKEEIVKNEELELPKSTEEEIKIEPTLAQEEAKSQKVASTEESEAESSNSELINSLKSIDTDLENKNINTDNSIEKLADEIIETESKEEVEHFVDNSTNNTTEKNELIEEVKDIEDTGTSAKESGLKRITKKLFPWGNKKNQEIELEDTSYETDLKSASELENKTETTVESIKENVTDEQIENTASDEIKVIDVDKEEKLEEIKEEVESQEPKITLEEEIKIPEVPSIKLDEEAEEKQKVHKVVEKIKVPEIPTIKPEEEIKEAEPVEAVKPIVELEKTDTEDIISKISTIEPEKENIEQPVKLESTEPLIQESIEQENELIIPEEQPTVDNIKPQVEVDKVEDINVVNDKDSNKITYKLMKLQIEGIDLEKNANKLSIDTSSYKMLLGNYLDEIEKYSNELESGATSTIDMLQDAGELLSLNLLTQKLEKLKNSNNKRNSTREISLMASLLKEKIENKPTEVEVSKVESIEIPDIAKAELEKDIEVETKKEISIPPIPDEIIDITSAQDLLTSINPQNVSFNPNRAADELNLPKTLILEFVEDFISQAKEHLPVIVDAYKKDDIKTIQTTAHMLKGAASNLRLDTIAENLFKIQKEGNISNSGELIKQFVSKLKGLSSEVASLEDAEDEN